jgi:protein-S-isoprenylcysteine O-methyltransferase Ste14
LNDLTTLLAFVLAFALWGFVHSLTASAGFKALAKRWMGESAFQGLYRLAYNVFSVISFLPVLYLAAAWLPDERVWSIPAPWRLLFFMVQLAGVAGVVRGQPDPGPPSELVTAGAYRLVRHPIYFFSLLVLWFNPVITWQTLVFNSLATLYFWLGSVYEERKLLSHFGETYETYRAKTPRLIPLKSPF